MSAETSWRKIRLMGIEEGDLALFPPVNKGGMHRVSHKWKRTGSREDTILLRILFLPPVTGALDKTT